METIWRLLGVVCFGLVLPQALGLMGYWWTRGKGLALRLTTLLIPAGVFLISAYLFWGSSARAIRESGNYVCGAFGAAAVISTIGGTLMNLILGVIIFLAANHFWKIKAPQAKVI